MITDKAAALIIDVIVVVIAAVAIYFGARAVLNGVIGFVQAPVQAELKASRGNQAAAKAGTDHQNVAIEGLKKAGDEKQEKSRAAVNAAGGVQFKRAAEIQAAPAVGESDYDRATNRIDRELGLK